MPYFSFKEIWTPLKVFKIRFFLEAEERRYWIKVGKSPRKRIS
jgi:hypothetical protein